MYVSCRRGSRGDKPKSGRGDLGRDGEREYDPLRDLADGDNDELRDRLRLLPLLDMGLRLRDARERGAGIGGRSCSFKVGIGEGGLDLSVGTASYFN